MQVHDLQPENKNKSKKRIGRGGSRGSFSGKGTKGQKKRAGATTPKYAEEQIKKFPKLRGIKNQPVTPETEVVNVGKIDSKFNKGDEVTKESLTEKGIISKKAKAIKILGDGEISKAVTVKDIPTSESAEEKIEDAGGEVI